MKIVAIIQARMGSTRLPGKVMADISGKPMLWHVINRVKRAKRVNEIVVATTDKEEDKQIARLAAKMGVKSYSGSEEDVLDRYYRTASVYNADVIVRIVADCPLIDPELIDRAIDFFLTNNFDYVSTSHPKPTFPDGLDIWVFSFSALKKSWEEAVLPSEREHVTPYIWKNPKMFKIATLQNDKDLSYMRWTVDEKRDLKFVREIYKRLYRRGRIFLTKDVIELLEAEPELMKINKGIIRDKGYQKSLKKDKHLKIT